MRVSTCLSPFSLMLSAPPDKSTENRFPRYVRSVKETMDLSTNPVLKSFLAGAFSGTCSTILFQPLDLIKTRLQETNVTTSGFKHTRTVGMLQVARQIFHRDSIFGFWRGLLPSVTRTVPGVGIYFGSLHWLRTRVCANDTPSPMQAAGMGLAARSFVGLVTIPLAVVKTRFESGKYNYVRMSTALVQIYSREGVRGLCLGLVPTLLRDAPFSGLYFMFYTQLKQKVFSRFPSKKKSFGNFSCGVCAGMLASMVTHPADVVKTKMQLQPDKFQSVPSTTKAIFSTTGPRGFLVGLMPRMLRRTLMAALAWTVYEEIMKQAGLK